jgi:hypothetical protein
MALNPSLTFFPATPPTEPPAAAAAVSTIDCPWAEPVVTTQVILHSRMAADGAAPRNRNTPRIIQYPRPNGISKMALDHTSRFPYISYKKHSAPLVCGSELLYD